MFRAAFALSALALAGSADAAPSPVYRALGTEPGWTLEIGGGQMRYLGDYGRTRITVPAPVARPTFNGRRYETARLTIDITRSPCTDGMSERLYAETVRVTAGRRTVRGCGAEIVRAAAIGLANSEWVIAEIDGRPVAGDRPTNVRFGAESVQGNAACNGFRGTYRVERGRLVVGPVMGTRMACEGPAMRAENRFLAVLGERPMLRAVGDGMLELDGASGSVLLRAVPGARPRF